MEPYFKTDSGALYLGDCAEILPRFPSGSFDMMVTDPPYGLAFMGKKWDYDVPSVETWKVCLRVLKPGAHALIFAGSRTQHRMAVNVEDAGFIIKDCLMWLYGSGFPKSADISKQIDKAAGETREATGIYKRSGKQKGCYGEMAGNNTLTSPATPEAKLWNGWGTHLKPAYEPILLVQKPNDGTYANNALTHGVAGINIDGGRVETSASDDIYAKNPHTKNKGENEIFGKYNGVKENYNPTKGRFPANVLLDEEAAAMLDEQSGVLTSGRKTPLLRDKKENLFKGFQYANVNHFPASQGGASRFFYAAKASKSERGTGNNHPTVKPLKLMEYLCKLLRTPTGGVMLDPFGGSGTHAVAAGETGLQWVLIEKETPYCEIARGRVLKQRYGASPFLP